MKKLFMTTAIIALTMTPLAAQAGKQGHDHDASKYSEHVQTKDIVSIALADENFSTLVAALKAAGLVEALQGDGPLTVFAPTNEAFEKLPEGTVENLLKPENKEKLQKILKYHVVASAVPSSAAAGNKVQLDTLAGVKADVDGRSGVKIGSANVTQADIQASNGIIHVIDAVLIPN